MNRGLFRLAQLLTVKYDLQSEAASLSEIVDRVKQDLINAYSLYVNGDKAKDPILQMLANAGEPFSKTLVKGMEEIVAGVDSLTAVQLFNRINKLLAAITEMKSSTSTVRDFIHNSVRVRTEAEKNHRERIKSKLEMVVSRLSSILTKQAKILRVMLPKDVPLEGGPVDPQRMNLSKEKLLIFMRTPAAQKYGLDNINVMTQLLSVPPLRQKITTLINSIDRGHIPADGPEVMEEAAFIRRWLDNTNQDATNLPALETEPERMEDPFRDAMQTRKQVSNEITPEELQKREELMGRERARQIEEDRERLIKSEGSYAALTRLLQRYS